MADAGALIALCPSAAVVDGGAGFRFTVLCPDGEAGAFLVRFRGRAFAYLNRCSHASTELDWREGQFFDDDGLALVCATHGALFDPESGGCLGGACAGRGGLRRLDVIEDQGVVYWRPDAGARPLPPRAEAG